MPVERRLRLRGCVRRTLGGYTAGDAADAVVTPLGHCGAAVNRVSL